jgi:hypothetical protein
MHGHERARKRLLQVQVAPRLVMTVTILTPDQEGLYTLEFLAGTTVYAGILQGAKGSQGGASATEPFGVLGQA